MRGSLAVHTALLELGINHEVYRLDRPSRSLQDAARSQGLSLHEVAKVTIFETARGPLAVIVPADLEPDADAVAAIASSDGVRRASAGASSKHTGFLADWIPPAGLRKAIPFVIDPRVLQNEVVYAAGGEPGVILKMLAEDLQTVTRGVVALVAPSRLTLVEGLAEIAPEPALAAGDDLADVT